MCSTFHTCHWTLRPSPGSEARCLSGTVQQGLGGRALNLPPRLCHRARLQCLSVLVNGARSAAPPA